jgi:hypothetical protein
MYGVFTYNVMDALKCAVGARAAEQGMNVTIMLFCVILK